MVKIGKYIFRFIFTVILTVLFIAFSIFILSWANYMTNQKYEILNNADLLNRYATKSKIIDLTELFIPASDSRVSTEYIVIHCDAIDFNKYETPQLFAIDRFHREERHWETIAYHYYITKNGSIYQLHKPQEYTIHAAGINNGSVAVCVQGNFDNDTLKEKQYNSLIKTLIHLKKIYPKAYIIGHCDVSTKTCPGLNIDVNAIRQTVNDFHIFKLKTQKK